MVESLTVSESIKAQGPRMTENGQKLLSDLGGKGMPGYPLIGRIHGLTELRGIVAALENA